MTVCTPRLGFDPGYCACDGYRTAGEPLFEPHVRLTWDQSIAC